MAFAPGDIVVLKSGGQPLTVVAVEADGVECLWIADNGELHRETLPSVALESVNDDETEDEDDAEDADEDNEDEH
jgi:uncharacterized protein YodC (DUF2158 family)